MSELKTEHLVYMSDDMYLPIHYKGIKVEQPYYQGDGNHSVAQLEAICRQFQEYVHQQQVIKQNCMKHIVELKFNIDFPAEENNVTELNKIESDIQNNKLYSKQEIESLSREEIESLVDSWKENLSHKEWVDLLKKHEHFHHDIGVNEEEVIQMWKDEHSC